MKKILFYIAQEYYWTGMKPVYDAFSKEDDVELFIKVDKNSKRYFYIFMISQLKQNEKFFIEQGYKVTRETKGFDAVVCGAPIKNPKRFGDTILFNVDHGPGIKTLDYRNLLKQPETRYSCFLEGKYRVEKFKKYGLDKKEDTFVVGLPKLDVFFNGYFDRNYLIKEFNIDPNKKTILYGPSYKPTSIFIIAEKLAELSNKYNVLVKLHPYSWSGKYAPHSQHIIFEKLSEKYPDLHLVSPSKHDILPYLFVADTMISDGSSVINEFLSLGKCGIIVDLEDNQLHSDGQPHLEEKNSEWLKDSFVHILSGDELAEAVEEAFNPSSERKEKLKHDKEYVFTYTDGRSGERAKNIIIQEIEKRNN